MSNIHTELFDVLFSYNRKSKTIVFKIYDRFQEYFSVWIDPDQKETPEDVEDAIRTSSMVICFVTKAYLKSNDCIKQIQMATQFKKIRVAIILEKNVSCDLIENFLIFNAFNEPNIFEPWSEGFYDQLFNLVSDLLNKRKLQFDTIIESKFLPLNLNQVIQNGDEIEKPKTDILLRPHALKTILEVNKPRKVKLNESIFNIHILSNGNLFTCNGHEGFSIYNESFLHIKTVKKLGGFCSTKKILCYFATSYEDSVICCCEIKPWNSGKYYAIIITDLNLKKLKILSTYNNEKQKFHYFQGINFFKDNLYVSSSVDIIKFSKTFELKSSHRLEFEPNEVALQNDVLCVTKHKSIIFY